MLLPLLLTLLLPQLTGPELERRIQGSVEVAAVAAGTTQGQCMASVGHRGFCDCVALYSPLGISFRDYVHIAVSNDATLKVETMSTEQRGWVATARDARDRCVLKQ